MADNSSGKRRMELDNVGSRPQRTNKNAAKREMSQTFVTEESGALFKRGIVKRQNWAKLFRPGTVVVERDQPKAYVCETYPTLSESSLSLPCWSWDFDGKFYCKKVTMNVPWPSDRDTTVITKLQVYPLDYAQPTLADELRARGKIFWSFRLPKFVGYSTAPPEDIEFKHRYMIDLKVYNKMHGKRPDQNSTRVELDDAEMLSDTLPAEPFALLLPDKVMGYGFHNKSFSLLLVKNICEIKWNKSLFEKTLILPESTKDLVRALLNNRREEEAATQHDSLANEGEGLVWLLHGGPGTGKTVAVESIAEIAELPIYQMNCADLGTEPQAVEDHLSSLFYIGNTWRCIVLLEEADVFLEERSKTDLQRSTLVSVFLRALEYYNGILILTTCRIENFDEAIKFRAQLSLHFPPLGPQEREKVWRNFLRFVQKEEEVEQNLGRLAEIAMNGRQIRNTFKTALQIALQEKKRLAYSHIEMAWKSVAHSEYAKDVHENDEEERASVTLVNSDAPDMEVASFSMYDYQKSLVESPGDNNTDVESILSMDDISQAETIASMVAYQQAATDIIKGALMGDDELSEIYQEALERVGRDRFLRNNCKLLQRLSKDLKTSPLLPSEHMAIRFLGGHRGSQLICTAICHDLAGVEIGHQRQLQLDPNEDKKTMLNRFLDNMDSAEQSGVFDMMQVLPKYEDDGDAVGSDDEGDKDFEEHGIETLEATVKFLVSGPPFQVYKQRLREWLHPPLLTHGSKQDGAPHTGFLSKNTFSVPELTNPTDATNVLIAGDTCFHHTDRHFNRAGCTLPDVQEAAPSTLAGEKDESDHFLSLKKRQGINTSLQPEHTTHDPVFSLSLPLLVDKILQKLPLPVTEPAVPRGMVRVYWDSCGNRMFDDYVELDPGAAAELGTALQKRYTLSGHSRAGGKSTSRFIQRILGLFRQQHVEQQQPGPDAELGEHELQTPSGSAPITNAGVPGSENGIPEQEALRLLLCVDDGRAKTKLEQEVLQNINDDRELFTYLRKQYYKKRDWFSLRSVGALSLAQFEVNYSNTTNVYRHESVCGITTDEHLDRDLGFYCLCIPPEERVGQDKEYLCNPAPKSRKRRLVPVLSPTMLKGDFLNPHFIAAGQRTTLNQLPKRRFQGKLRATPDALETGWGIHIEEDWHWPTIYCCFVAIILFSLVFGIAWSVKRNDIQGAFAVSGFALTLGGMLLGYLAIPKS